MFQERLDQLQQRLEQFLPDTGSAKLTIGFHSGNSREAHFARRGECLTAVLPNADYFFADDRTGFNHYMAYLPILIYLASRANHRREMIADVHDGTFANDRLTFSSNAGHPILIPDPSFFSTRGYAAERMAEGQIEWQDRSNQMLWRGSTTGLPEKDAGPADLLGDRTIQRIRFCLALKEMRGVDAKLSAVIAPFDRPGDAEVLSSAGICGSFVSADVYKSRKFAFDLDGNSNAWSNLFTRLLNGCCVLKVASPHGFRQWYYERLVPWVHYVPVRADLADLKQQLEWCWEHVSECRDIARAGRDLALSITFDRELQNTVAELDRHFGAWRRWVRKAAQRRRERSPAPSLT